jgi:nitrate reductase (cytochrome), electron transfer subunit
VGRSPISGCLLIAALLGFAGCAGDAPAASPADSVAAEATPFAVRAARRAYDGAPPVLPHQRFPSPCLSCHAERRVEIAGLGVAPPSPHGLTPGMAAARCDQCHVPRDEDRLYTRTRFEGLEAGWSGPAHRLYPGAPPVVPHRIFMREDCLACHSGPAARPEIRTTHPERVSCLQCHARSRGD